MTDSTDQTMQEMIARLGLERNPFDGDETGVFFVGGQRRFLVQQAVHALYFARGVVLLSGAEGAGKTRIVGEVCEELAELVDICRLDASVMMDAGEIRQRLTESLGLAAEAALSVEALLAGLEQLKPDEGDPLPVLLAIDDAQQLGVPVLAECHALASASAGRIRLLLAGAPELLQAWSQAGNPEADQIDVLPLDAQETADYVATCLQAAGYRGEIPLTDEQWHALYRESRGNIGAIGSLIPALLVGALGGPAGKPHRRRLPSSQVAIVAAVVALIGVAAVFLRGGDGSADTPATAAVEMSPEGRQSIPLALPTVPSQDETGAVGPVQPAAVAAPSVETSPSVPVVSSVPATPVAKPVPVPKSVPVPKPVVAPAVEAVAKSSGGKTLAEMPPGEFVVQLMAGSSRRALDAFVANSASGVRVFTYETRRDGKPWFVAVTGPYPDRNVARAAISTLPRALRDQHPWPRSVASVQVDLRAR